MATEYIWLILTHLSVAAACLVVGIVVGWQGAKESMASEIYLSGQHKRPR